jgi:rhamnose utilization protein RhaD (predicted bifunctional aldolase and dehydrogenase)
VFDRKLSNVADALAVADDPTIGALLARSNRLGADKRVTNFAGGNTSAKLALPDPITGEPTRVLAVKGSGGDLGTMTISGLAFLDLVAS